MKKWYWFRVAKRACQNTTSALGHNSRKSLAGWLAMFIALELYANWKGGEHAWDKLEWWIVCLCAAGVVFLFVLLWQFLKTPALMNEELTATIKERENSLALLQDRASVEKRDLQRKIDDVPASFVDVREMLRKIALKGDKLKTSSSLLFSCESWFMLCKDFFVLAFGQTQWQAFDFDPAINRAIGTQERIPQTVENVANCLRRHANNVTQEHIMSGCTKGELAAINQRLQDIKSVPQP